jgi:pullulanase/glycogen debranching enzyme
MDPEIWPGQPYPLGASYDGIGTNFTLFSSASNCASSTRTATSSG